MRQKGQITIFIILGIIILIAFLFVSNINFEVNGVGEKKFAQYGEEFLSVINP